MQAVSLHMVTSTERALRAKQAERRTRVPRGNIGGGQFVSEMRAESAIALGDERVEEHELSHLGIFTVTRRDGTVVARNISGPGITCPVCRGEKRRQASCSECSGRGIVSDVPFCERPWDEIHTTSAGGAVFLGGHDCQPEGGSCVVTDQFDTVVSLFSREGYGPDNGVEHHAHALIDGDLDSADHERIRELAAITAEAARDGKRVLVRCQAGMNRSGLVAGCALVDLGIPAEAAINQMRAARGPYVLFNEGFVAFIREHRSATVN